MSGDFNIKKFKKQNALKTPEGYFESFNLKMTDTISSNEEKVSAMDRFIYSLRLRFTIPALAVCFLALFSIFYSISDPDNTITDSDIQNYLLEDEQLLAQDHLFNLNFPLGYDITIEDEDILEYLEEENSLETLTIYESFN